MTKTEQKMPRSDEVLKVTNRAGGPLDMSEIAFECNTHSPVIHAPVQKLVEAGYLERDKIDGIWTYTITQAGKDYVLAQEEGGAAALREPGPGVDIDAVHGNRHQGHPSTTAGGAMNAPAAATKPKPAAYFPTVPTSDAAELPLAEKKSADESENHRCVTGDPDRAETTGPEEKPTIHIDIQEAMGTEFVSHTHTGVAPAVSKALDTKGRGVQGNWPTPSIPTVPDEDRFGYFTNGELHIHASGDSVVLNKGQANELRKFISSLGQRAFE